MSLLTAANLLLLFAIVAYYGHSYQHSTMDFMHYKVRIAIPVTNVVMKYLYVHSFILFVISAAAFMAVTAIRALQLTAPLLNRALFGFSVVLAIGAARLLSLPAIGYWRKRR